jgi:hypothetical protein
MKFDATGNFFFPSPSLHSHVLVHIIPGSVVRHRGIGEGRREEEKGRGVGFLFVNSPPREGSRVRSDG